MVEWVNRPCTVRATGEMLDEAIRHLRRVRAHIISVNVEAVVYRIEFTHPDFDGCEMEMRCSIEGGAFTTSLRNLGPVDLKAA